VHGRGEKAVAVLHHPFVDRGVKNRGLPSKIADRFHIALKTLASLAGEPRTSNRESGIRNIGRAADRDPRPVAGGVQRLQDTAIVPHEACDVHGFRGRGVAGVIVAINDQDRVLVRPIKK
jgi:hypothetical protein